MNEKMKERDALREVAKTPEFQKIVPMLGVMGPDKLASMEMMNILVMPGTAETSMIAGCVTVMCDLCGTSCLAAPSTQAMILARKGPCRFVCVPCIMPDAEKP